MRITEAAGHKGLASLHPPSYLLLRNLPLGSPQGQKAKQENLRIRPSLSTTLAWSATSVPVFHVDHRKRLIDRHSRSQPLMGMGGGRAVIPVGAYHE